MAHLHSFRKGWQSEHLAKYILSKFSFVSEPATVSDDLGSDFFCTLFKIVDKNFLQPQNTIAIQIKSIDIIRRKKNQIEFDKNYEYLLNLEIPFFIGIVDKKKSQIKIYSGENLPSYFSMYGRLPIQNKSKPIIKLLKGRTDIDYYAEENNYFVNFPFVIELSENFNYEESDSKLNEFFYLSKFTQRNLASKFNQEYLFNSYKTPDIPHIVTGPGSVLEYEKNFYKRLAEVFANYWWSLRKMGYLNFNDFFIFKRFFLELDSNKDLPEYLTNNFILLSSEVNKIYYNNNLSFLKILGDRFYGGHESDIHYFNLIDKELSNNILMEIQEYKKIESKLKSKKIKNKKLLLIENKINKLLVEFCKIDKSKLSSTN